jgi:hypothetical protein
LWTTSSANIAFLLLQRLQQDFELLLTVINAAMTGMRSLSVTGILKVMKQKNEFKWLYLTNVIVSRAADDVCDEKRNSGIFQD